MKDRDYDAIDSMLFNANSGFANMSTSDFDADEIKELLRMARGNDPVPATPMSRDIVCHPDNLKQLQKRMGTVETDIDNCSFLHQINAYRITTDVNCPKYQVTKDSKVIWHDTQFVTYSDGPSSDMCYEDYVSMCVFMGWAEQEGELVFYYLDESHQWPVSLRDPWIPPAHMYPDAVRRSGRYLTGNFKYVYPNPDIDRWNRLNVGEYTGIRYPATYPATFKTEPRGYWKTIKKCVKIFLFGQKSKH